MDKFLRAWRQDALNRGQIDAAIYIGDKVLAVTSRYDQALSILGEENPTHLISTTHNARRKLAHTNGTTSRFRSAKGHRDRIEASEERERDREQEKEIKFQAGMCYLRGLCFAKRNAFDKARDCYKDAVRIDVQCFEAFEQLMKNSLMSPAEELAFLNELDFSSIRVDEPSLADEAADFTKLLYTTRLSKYASPSELSNAVETLSTHYNLASNADLLLTRAETLYTQCRFHEALAITTDILNSQSDLGSSADSSSAYTAASLGHTPNLYPLHLALLYETGAHNTLFHLSHALSNHAPHESYTYLAIGTYYLSTSRISEARRFFSKASLMDPHSAPAWIGFAHTFAAEGEHDQAIAAYSTAARLFQGSHLPQLFLGMQHLALNNMALAWEYCIAAFEMSSGQVKTSGSEAGNADASNRIMSIPAHLGGDPLVLNEIGVILYHQSNLPAAARLFKRALELAADLGCNMTAWIATRANLAHTLRRLHRLDEALAEFDECLRTATGGSGPGPSQDIIASRTISQFADLTIGHGSAGTVSGAASGYEERNLLGSIHTSRGIVLLSMMGRTREAIMALHEAVRILGGDSGGGGVAGTLLSRAMEIWALEEAQEEAEEENEDRMAKANINLRSRRKGRETLAQEPDEQEAGSFGGILLSGPNGRKSHREKVLEKRLDDDADEMLNAAFGLRELEELTGLCTWIEEESPSTVRSPSFPLSVPPSDRRHTAVEVLRAGCSATSPLPNPTLTRLPTMTTPKYLIVSLPTSVTPSGHRDDVLSSVQKAVSSSYGEVAPFNTASFKIGTLDALIQQSDDLAKLEALANLVVAKVGDTLKNIFDGDESKIAQHKSVNDKPLEQYLKSFSWNKVKYRADKPIAELVDLLQKEVNSIDNDVRAKYSQYNSLRTSLQQLQKRQTGNLSTKSLTSVVKPGTLLNNSDHLETQLVAVPNSYIKDFARSYETLSTFVVPRSAVEVSRDDEYTLYAVTLFKKYAAEFVHKAREKKWVPRDFKFKEGGQEAEVKEVKKTEAEERRVWGETLRLGRTGWSEAVQALVHIIVLRVFVESVLRYGLPPDFVGALIKTDRKRAEKARKGLDTQYAYLAGNAFGRDKKGRASKEEGVGGGAGADLVASSDTSDYSAYVVYEIDLD
ncbi:hypothetical protein DV738_g2833, partial [Chaetothyriales sp. CBS 135597]